MREVWIDRWKGLLILLVVVGHVVGGAAHLATDAARPWLEGVYRVIYLFHMPAFFALAGCCWKPATGSFAAFALKKAKRLLVPYAVFGVVSVVLYLLLQQVFLARTGAGVGGHYAAMGGEDGWRPFLSLLHAGGWPHGEGFRANTPLWFLPCLFTVELVYCMLDRFTPGCARQLACAVLALSLGFVVHVQVPFDLPWGAAKAPWFLAFLIAGRWILRPAADALAAAPMPKGGVPIAVAVGCLLYAVGGWFMPSQWFMGRLGWYVAFAACALLGTLLSLLAARFLPGRGLATLGGLSLTILLVHKFPVMALETQVPWMRQLFQTGCWGAVLGCLVVTILALIGCGLVHGIMRKYLPFAIGLKKGENK